MAWLRMKSGSIIPVAIMHATHNGIIQVFLDRITADTGITSYFTGEFGIALIFFTLAMALYFWREPITGEDCGMDDCWRWKRYILIGYFPSSLEHLAAQFRYTVNQPDLNGKC